MLARKVHSFTCRQITTICLLLQFFISAELSTVPADGSNITIAQGLLTFSECQHVICAENSELLSANGVVGILHSALVPFELYFKYLPHGDPQNQIRRHRSHCLVRSILLSFLVHSYDIAKTVRFFNGDFTWDKEKDVTLLFQPFSLVIHLPENQRYMRFCELPLNLLVVFYDRKSLMITSQRVVKQCCEHGKLVCFFELNILGQKQISFEGISASWKQLRSQFNGCLVTYDGPASGYTWQILTYLRQQPLYLFHQYYRISLFQLLYIFNEKLNITFDTHSTTGSTAAETRNFLYCSNIIIMERYRPIVRPTPGASRTMPLAGVRWYQAFYTEDNSDTAAPYRLQSTLYPSETKAWLLLLLCIFLWTLVSILLIGKGADITAVFLAVMCPFTAQLFPYVAIEKLKLWFTLWVACSIILLAAYGNTVKSITAVPTAKTGTKTVEDLMDQNYSMFLSFASGKADGALLAGAKFYELELTLLEYLEKFREDRREFHPSLTEFFNNSHNFDILEDWKIQVTGIEFAKLVKKNVYFCKEHLFQQVSWWSTNLMPNSDVATWQFQLMTVAGFVDYWKRIQVAATLESMKNGLKQLAAQEGLRGDLAEISFAGTLAESLTHESFIILLYGLALSLVIFVLEVVSKFIEVSVAIVADEEPL